MLCADAMALATAPALAVGVVDGVAAGAAGAATWLDTVPTGGVGGAGEGPTAEPVTPKGTVAPPDMIV